MPRSAEHRGDLLDPREQFGVGQRDGLVADRGRVGRALARAQSGSVEKCMWISVGRGGAARWGSGGTPEPSDACDDRRRDEPEPAQLPEQLVVSERLAA